MFRYNITTNLENIKFYEFLHDRKSTKAGDHDAVFL